MEAIATILPKNSYFFGTYSYFPAEWQHMTMTHILMMAGEAIILITTTELKHESYSYYSAEYPKSYQSYYTTKDHIKGNSY